MRDIVPYAPEQPQPDRAPRPVPPAPRATFRRRLGAYLLAGLLGVAALGAIGGTLIASVRGIGGQDGPALPWSSIFATVSDTYHRLMGTAANSLAVLSLGRDALALAPDLLQGRRGDEFIALLDRAEDTFASLGSTSLVPQLGATGAELATGAGTTRAWLTGAAERKIAVVFGNSAEMRAGGGFIGSYAEVTLAGGSIKSITVRDITEADRASADKTIPPVPLEPVADRWRAADANWFLSGPQSGAAFLDLLNRSDLYKDAPVDAAVFVAPRVVSELLDVTGPLAAGGVTVDAANFLRVIQAEVQEGQAAGAESPKEVLSALVPAFTTKLLASTTSSPLKILDALRGAISRRDIVAYASDPAFERVIESLGVSGALYPTGRAFTGAYIAVAPSTIGGDKTDAVTDEAIHAREQLFPSGLVETTVQVERTHRGTEDDPWWYQEDHRSYVKVYAPEGAQPTAASGVWQRERATASYDGSFSAYPAVTAIESTARTYTTVPGVEAFEETGKTVLGFWQRTARGTGTAASVTYARELPRALQAGDAYTLVVERQPASTATYDVELFAPTGLMWEETGTSRYVWQASDPAGRTVLPLKLVAAQ